jgi:RHS repeat-associated protein
MHSGRLLVTIYGKLLSLTDSSSNTISFTYDASRNRISKVSHGITTWYVRDAQGNVMSVYTQNNSAIHGDSLSQTEIDLYGSSRLGILNLSLNCAAPLTMPASGSWVRGAKFFELTNHLGNVLETISDKKIQHTSDSSTADYYVADVAGANDYYAFGMQMPSRSVAAGGYRYGFNGKEDDNEVKGNGNQINYGFRIYDPRIGRFLSFDPYFKEYCDLSPYHYAGNNPIQNLDMDGGEPQDYEQNWQYRRFSVNGGTAKYSRNVMDPQLGVIDVEAVYDKSTKQTWFIHQSDDGRNYYWKHNPGADQSIRMAGNGKWVEFETQNRIAYEQTVALARGIEGFFAAAFVAPFAWAGIVEGGSLAWGAIETSSVNATANAALTYYRLAPAIGAAGKLFAEVFDESGSVMTGGSGGVKIAEMVFQEAKGLVGATSKFEGGKALDFLANKVVNGKTLELTDAILYPANARGNELKGEFGKGAIKSILEKLKNYAKSQGFDKLRITYHRAENSSSADLGHVVDKVFDLNK